MSRTPTFSEALQEVLESHAGRLRAVEPAAVETWHRVSQIATVRPLVRDRPGERRAAIHGVPVIQPTAYHDLQEGEVGLLLVCDRSPRRWWRNGEESEPETTGAQATHAVQNAVFLPGLRSRSGARTLPDDVAVVEKPASGGEVRLGDVSATEPVLCGDKTDDAIMAWANAVSNAFTSLGVDVTGALATLQADLDAAKSPSVMVED